ncbi:MAG: hypothetical protein JSS30_08595 [Verrucomicrobia bacterium]|nr:hypothetical protein [Verrucomicrobiota bacterium]
MILISNSYITTYKKINQRQTIMATPAITSNSWNTVYSWSPDFGKLERHIDKFVIPFAVGIMAAAFAAQYMVPDHAKSIVSGALIVGGASVGTKAALLVGKYLNTEIYKKTDAGIKEAQDLEIARERSQIWGNLKPPSNLAIDAIVKENRVLEKKIDSAYPIPRFIYESADNKAPFPIITTYDSLDSFEADCDRWMQNCIQMGHAVRDDLRAWSEQEIFKRDDQPVQHGQLLQMQPGWCNRADAAPWLYKGFFHLPEAYRILFNLPAHIDNAIIQRYEKSPIHKSYAEKYLQSYPVKNRELLQGWHAKFFQEGTKQYAWREAYNRIMQETFELAEGITDKRFINWGGKHDLNQYQFSERPDTMPT